MMNPITSVLSKVSGLPEPTLRLLLTLVLAYPTANLYHTRFSTQHASTPQERTQFILLSGLALNFFFNGFSIIHTLITVGASYVICLVVGEQLGDRKLAATGVWILNALYLLLGYYFMQTDDYDITWTMTQCILCLRMMGFAFDYYDGRQRVTMAGPVQTGETNKTAIRKTADKKPPVVLPLSFLADTPLTHLPTFVELLAYCVFPSAFLVGPQFSYSLFKKWIQTSYLDLTLEQKEERERAQTAYVIRCVALAVVYLALQQTVGAAYSTSYLLTEEYQSFGFLKRALIFIVAGKFAYNKYIGIWLLTEGATAAYGISYEGDDEEGHALFGGLANTLPATYETATSIDHIISAFNINTNLWSKYYVFKRLKFLGNKQASQFGTLFFLAIWHGFHIMYFVTFALEFLYVACEQVLRARLLPVVQPYTKQNEVYFYAWKALAWLTCQLTITYAVVGFELLKVGKSFTAYKSVWFLGHLAIPLILGAHHFLPKPRVKKTA